jgi:putative ABC transport system ATP-binding protein
MRMLRFLCREQGKTIIVVTHDPSVASYADRMIKLLDGNIIEDKLMRPPRTTRTPDIAPPKVNSWSAVEEAIVEDAAYVD